MYETTITKSSKENIAPIDRIIFSKPGNAETISAGMTLNIIDWAKVHVKNDESDSKEYDVLVMKCIEGVYQTSSEAFISGIEETYDALNDTRFDDVADGRLAEGDWYVVNVKVGERKSKSNANRKYFYPLIGGAHKASEVL